MPMESERSARDRRYVKRFLALDPSDAFEEIWEARCDYVAAREPLGPAESLASIDARSLPDLPGVDTPEEREFRAQLELLRTEVWTVPAEETLARIASLPTARYPHFEGPVRRLSVIANSRDWLIASAKRRGKELRAVELVAAVLTQREPVAASLRREVLEGSTPMPPFLFLTSARVREFDWDFLCQLLSKIQRSKPDLYALEAAWFDAVTAKQSKRQRLEAAVRAIVIIGGVGVWLWLRLR